MQDIYLADFSRVYQETLTLPEIKALFGYVSQGAKGVASAQAVEVLRELEGQVRAAQVREISQKIEMKGDLGEVVAKKARFVMHGKAH